MQLRHNQIEPVEKGVDFFKQKKSTPSIIIAPTAFGKSIVIAAIAKKLNDKILIIQPSKELLEQNYAKFQSFGGTASIYSASLNTKEIGDVTYATIKSILDQGANFYKLGINKVIVDECDRYPRDPSGMLRTFFRNAKIKHVLGLTATPLKLQNGVDSEGYPYSMLKMLTSYSKKGTLFKEILHVAQVKEMVDLHFWSPLIYRSFEFDESQLKFNTSKSDYTEESMEKAFDSQGLPGKIKKLIELLEDRKSILVAVPSVKQAILLSNQIPNSCALYSGMPLKQRTQIIEDFKSKKIRTIIQVNILTIGFDYPELDCIICARPTASLSWWYQFVGRLTRIHPNKENGLIVDFVGSLSKFGKVEDLYFKKIDNHWQLFGEGGRLLSDIPMHEIGLHFEDSQSEDTSTISTLRETPMVMPFGKYENVALHKIPKEYRDWMLSNFQWSITNKDLKNELLRLRKLGF